MSAPLFVYTDRWIALDDHAPLAFPLTAHPAGMTAAAYAAVLVLQDHGGHMVRQAFVVEYAQRFPEHAPFDFEATPWDAAALSGETDRLRAENAALRRAHDRLVEQTDALFLLSGRLVTLAHEIQATASKVCGVEAEEEE